MPLIYWPAGLDMGRLTIHVRSEGDAAQLAKQVSSVLGRSSGRVQPLRAVMAVALFPAQAAAVLLSSLGLVGWALTIAGLYGLVGYSVNRRVPEIGVRIALGATAGRILRLVLCEGTVIVAAGLGLGLAVSAVGSPLLALLLSGVDPHDVFSFAAPALGLLATALAAAYGPARKGTKIPPMRALRTE
jgi:ABC-type antimicrobial peptide transport system permease subunit